MKELNTFSNINAIMISSNRFITSVLKLLAEQSHLEPETAQNLP